VDEQICRRHLSQRWFFNQFGDLVIGTHGGAPVKYTLSTGAGALLGGSPPSASFSAVCKGFLGLAGDASDASTITWSGLEDPEGYTVGTNESDQQTIPDGGPITGLAGGERFVIFQRSAITLGEYVGVPYIFVFRKISDEVGCLHHGSIARNGPNTFFLSEQGFKMLTSDEQIIPIGQPDETGQGGVDQTFLDAYTTSEIEGSISAAIDPAKKLVIWSMPGRLWLYHWPSGKWSDVLDSAIAGVSYGMTASATLEGIAVLFPSIEDVTPNLDDAYWRGGNRLLLYAKTDFTLYTASGDNLEYTIKTAKLEPFPGRDAHIRTVRPDSDATALTLNVDMSRTLHSARNARPPATCGTMATFRSGQRRALCAARVRQFDRHLFAGLRPGGYAWGLDVSAIPSTRTPGWEAMVAQALNQTTNGYPYLSLAASRPTAAGRLHLFRHRARQGSHLRKRRMA
jgi:hypothetical protein